MHIAFTFLALSFIVTQIHEHFPCTFAICDWVVSTCLMGMYYCRTCCNEKKCTAVSDSAIHSRLSSCCSCRICGSSSSYAYPTSISWTAAEHASSLCIPTISVRNASGKMLHTISNAEASSCTCT